MQFCENETHFFHRDKELEIITIEKFSLNPHTNSTEKDNSGKNYLLETYLNQLPLTDNNVEDTKNIIHNNNNKETINGNSDSGVHTEDATTTPEVGTSSNTYVDTETARNKPITTIPTDYHHKRLPKKNASLPIKHNQHHHYHKHPKRNYRKTSKRETKLLKDHASSKEFLLVSQQSSFMPDGKNDEHNYDDNDTETNDNNDESTDSTELNSVHHQVGALQKLVTINKHLQREEELLLRLMTKIRNYNSDTATTTIDDDVSSANQIRTAIDQVNYNMNSTNSEIKRLEIELQKSQEILSVKSDVINRLSIELEEIEISENKYKCGGNLYDLQNHVILTQAPLYFQKDDFETATVNLHCDQRNVNKFAATGMTNAKVGPKKLINEFYKDHDLIVMNGNGDGGGNEYPLLGTLV